MRLPTSVRLVSAQRLTVAQRQGLFCFASGHVACQPETRLSIILTSATTVSRDSRSILAQNPARRSGPDARPRLENP